MKHSRLSKTLALFLAMIMLVSVLPLNAFAVQVDFDISKDIVPGVADYQLISRRDWDLAPGIAETEIVLNNETGTRRQVLHTVTVDLNNPYTKVIPGTKGMWPQAGNYGVESTSVQALNAEKLGYGNVVAATNCSLSWYTEAYYQQNPHLIGEPLGYSILDGEFYSNSRFVEGSNGGGVQTIIVINYDKHPITGEDRPADMPRVWIRKATDPLTGWEEQAIPVLFKLLFWPDAETGEIVLDKSLATGDASRTFVGVKADGTLVVTVSDGEQAPYSFGFNEKEMADYMLKMGCVIAANCDGGGSSTFCSQRPGEEFKVNCSLADGGERPTSNTIIVISTAPADGVFARAAISAEYDYYTPGSSVAFTALGTDAVGTKVDVPADVEWAIKEDGMGTIENGVFTSNGTEGTVTAQMIYNGQIVGEHSVTIAAPEEIFFEQPVVTIPFGKTAIIPVKASIGGGLYRIGLGANDVTFTTTNEALGYFDGLNFIAVEEENAPADLTSTVTATLASNPSLTATVQLNLGKASEVLWDFEGGQADIDIWNVINNRKNAAHWDYELSLSLADRTNGQVHDGNYSMRLETNGLHSKDSHSEQYAWIRLGVDGEAITLKNARSVGFWLYVPEDNIQCWVQGHYKTDSDGDGVFDTDNLVSMMESENVYYNIDESGWHYLSMDISAFSEVALQADKKYDLDPSDGMTGETGEFFLALVFHKAINNKLWQENGSINGNYTYYLDNFTVDYSEAVEDRENPVFDKVYANGTALIKRDVVTINDNVLNLSVAAADASVRLDANKNEVPLYNATGLNPDSAKAYIDGVQVPCTFANGTISANATVADGYHRVKFEVCDNAGNKSVIIRVVKVESGVEASTLKLVPADATLDRIPFGSIYWMNLEATAIETIQSVSTVIDLNNVNHWQLDNMYLADGFSAEYTIAEETNTATITITRTGENEQTGEAVLAKLPVRILYFDTDIQVPGYTAETYWTTYKFWAQDMKMDVDKGEITYVEGYESDVLSVFSNEEFHVDTEMYTSMANMDKAYFTEHGTTHVHTPAAIDDQAPTCTQPGYEGRTFCAGCNSVVEWGTTVPATGHTYEVVGDKLICDCGAASKVTGLHIIDGKGYYTIAGTLTTGWLTIDEEWYYFDETTYSSVPTYFNDYVTYEFEADGKLISGKWYKTSEGYRYYEGPSYIRGGKSVMTWYEIDGEMYCIDKRGYVATGTRWVNDNNEAEIYTWYNFDEYGRCQGKYEHSGLAEWNGNIYYLKDGVNQYGMYLIDGEYYYFYFTNYRAGIKNQEFTCNYNNGLLPAGSYTFGADGKMLNNDVYNGIFNADGYLYYYEMGKKSQGTGVFTYNGVDYPIEADGKVLFTGTLTDASGQTLDYVDGFHDHIPMNGIYGDYYYVDDVLQKAYQLFVYEGDYYFINDGNKIAKSCKLYLSEKFLTGKTLPDGTPFPAGLYIFDADGKITNVPYVEPDPDPTEPEVTEPEVTEPEVTEPEVTEPEVTEPEVLNGIVGDYYYIDGVLQKSYLLFEYEGDYYFINDGDKVAKNCRLYLGERFVAGVILSDGSAFPAGLYSFGADGKITNPPPVVDKTKNGIIGDYYYIEGILQKSCLLFEYEGDYYFLNDGDKIAKNCRLYLSEKFVAGITLSDGNPFPAGLYSFGADGKITNPPPVIDKSKNGIIGDYYYIEGILQKSCLLFEYEGDYYFLNDGDKIAKNCRLYLSDRFVTGVTLSDGSAFPAGLYSFGADGKITNLPPVIDKSKNGIIDDYYYIDGVLQKSCLLFEYEGNYYFLNSGDKIFRNGKLYLSERFVTGVTLPDGSAFPAGLYIFDDEGKITNLPG